MNLLEIKAKHISFLTSKSEYCATVHYESVSQFFKGFVLSYFRKMSLTASKIL